MRNLKKLDIPMTRNLVGGMNCINDDFIVMNDLQQLGIEKGYPVKLGVLGISLCLYGDLTVEINMIEHHVSAGNLVITLPEDILQHNEISDHVKGLFIIVSQRFIEEAFPQIEDILPVFLHIQRHPCLNLSAQECVRIQGFYNFFVQHLEDNSPYRDKIVRSILQSMIYYIAGVVNLDKDNHKKERKEELFSHFVQLIIKNYKKSKKLDFYAQQLFISPKYLSDIIKKISGQSAHDWIDRYILLEAKILLRTSDKTIAQIADELNFPNNSFFSKYFKKNCGITPKEYRRRNSI
ncbi:MULTISPECIES: helix-turn-helix domain-containing protein [Bacteroidales]|uniref:helix-turn-helix domain-containing protein n=1 Tax=Bacteroidales TaxID=171549 RepID=UPI001F25F87C|nr:helix-turn-helix domain-containing protein [Parabacteroides distasonis]MCE9040956.1 helix-turn-helix domain-containing protein [Parabacteroides distasonis]